jgi:hypothetical protein
MRLRVTSLILVLAMVAGSARSQEAAKVCADGRIIKIVSQWDELGKTMSESQLAAQPLRYSISSTKGVQGAWVEVWDRPKRLSRETVALRREGEASCVRCGDADQTPEELHLWIFDPAAPSEPCIDFCPDGLPTLGEYVAEILAGKKPVEESDESDEPAYLMDDPKINGTPIRIEEGTVSTTVVLSGENLIASTRVFLVSGDEIPKGTAASRDYLYSRTLDLHHIEVVLPSYFLKQAGVLMLYAKDSSQGQQPGTPQTGQKITVASKDSPVIESVDPKVLKGNRLDAEVTLRGSGFTEHSEVKYGDEISSSPDVTFVSSNELRVSVSADEIVVGPYTRATPVTLTVANDSLHVSAPFAVRVVPTARYKRQPLAAVIRAIVPFPVPMMDSQSPERVALEIEGDNFRTGDVVFMRGGGDRSRLKTQYISPHHLRAWLPRESWRKHRLSFRLLVQTAAGRCAAEAFSATLE